MAKHEYSIAKAMEEWKLQHSLTDDNLAGLKERRGDQVYSFDALCLLHHVRFTHRATAEFDSPALARIILAGTAFLDEIAVFNEFPFLLVSSFLPIFKAHYEAMFPGVTSDLARFYEAYGNAAPMPDFSFAHRLSETHRFKKLNKEDGYTEADERRDLLNLLGLPGAYNYNAALNNIFKMNDQLVVETALATVCIWLTSSAKGYRTIMNKLASITSTVTHTWFNGQIAESSFIRMNAQWSYFEASIAFLCAAAERASNQYPKALGRIVIRLLCLRLRFSRMTSVGCACRLVERSPRSTVQVLGALFLPFSMTSAYELSKYFFIYSNASYHAEPLEYHVLPFVRFASDRFFAKLANPKLGPLAAMLMCMDSAEINNDGVKVVGIDDTSMVVGRHFAPIISAKILSSTEGDTTVVNALISPTELKEEMHKLEEVLRRTTHNSSRSTGFGQLPYVPRDHQVESARFTRLAPAVASTEENRPFVLQRVAPVVDQQQIRIRDDASSDGTTGFSRAMTPAPAVTERQTPATQLNDPFNFDDIFPDAPAL